MFYGRQIVVGPTLGNGRGNGLFYVRQIDVGPPLGKWWGKGSFYGWHGHWANVGKIVWRVVLWSVDCRRADIGNWSVIDDRRRGSSTTERDENFSCICKRKRQDLCF